MGVLYRLSYACTRRASFRAGDGARTRDIKLGRLALYQLSYSRKPGPSLPIPASLHAVARTLHRPANPAPLWWGKDSNLRRRAPEDLQSAPVGHLGTPPGLDAKTPDSVPL